MKKVIISMLTLLLAGQVHAQVAHWIIRPVYDSIYFASGANLIITDSLNKKTVWTIDGKKLFNTYDKLNPFKEDITVTTEQNSDRILGFYPINGTFSTLEDCYVAHDYPYFSEGYLVVKKGDKYYFIDAKKQNLDAKGFDMAYPFSLGFASCSNYQDSKKSKDPFNFLINKDNKAVHFSLDGKKISDDNIEFISSINDKEGKGIIVIKKKHLVYSYFNNGKEMELQPLLFPDETDLKKQARLNGKISDCLVELGNSNQHILYAKCGESTLSIVFNTTMVPVEIRYDTKVHPLNNTQTTKEEPNSPLHITKEKKLYGISINGKETLPAQFEAINGCFGNNAFVKLKGKHGLIYATKDYDFLASINSGKKICFRHGTVDTKIHIEMPTFVPSEKTTVESLDTSCIINKTSWVHRKTPQGNSIEYDCTLKFPNELYKHTLLFPDNPKQQTIKIEYPIQITSEEIVFPEITLEADVWYHKYITIDPNESDKTVNKGVGIFTFDIKAEIISDDDFSPLEVRIVADSSYLEPECEQLPSNNRRYKGTVYNLREGPNDITIEILEEGCPPIQYPHTIIYTKPSAKNKQKKENIDIKKKTEEEDNGEDLHFRF